MCISDLAITGVHTAYRWKTMFVVRDDEFQDENRGTQAARVLAASFLIFSVLTVVRVQQARYEDAAKYRPPKKSKFQWESSPFLARDDTLLSAVYLNSNYAYAPVFHNTRTQGIVAESTPNSTFVIAPEIVDSMFLKSSNFASFGKPQPLTAAKPNENFPDIIAVTIDTQLYKRVDLPGCPRPSASDAAAVNGTKYCYIALQSVPGEFCTVYYRRKASLYRSVSLQESAAAAHSAVVTGAPPDAQRRRLSDPQQSELTGSVLRNSRRTQTAEMRAPSGIGHWSGGLRRLFMVTSSWASKFSQSASHSTNSTAHQASAEVPPLVGEWSRQHVSWTCSAGGPATDLQCIRVISGPSLEYIHDTYTVSSPEEIERYKALGGGSYVWGDSNSGVNATEVHAMVSKIIQDEEAGGDSAETGAFAGNANDSAKVEASRIGLEDDRKKLPRNLQGLEDDRKKLPRNLQEGHVAGKGPTIKPAAVDQQQADENNPGGALPRNRMDDPSIGMHFCGKPYRHLITVDNVNARMFFLQPLYDTSAAASSARRLNQDNVTSSDMDSNSTDGFGDTHFRISDENSSTDSAPLPNDLLAALRAAEPDISRILHEIRQRPVSSSGGNSLPRHNALRYSKQRTFASPQDFVAGGFHAAWRNLRAVLPSSVGGDAVQVVSPSDYGLPLSSASPSLQNDVMPPNGQQQQQAVDSSLSSVLLPKDDEAPRKVGPSLYCVSQYFFGRFSDVTACEPVPRPADFDLPERPPLHLRYDELTEGLVFFEFDSNSSLVLTIMNTSPVSLRFSICLENLRSGWVLASDDVSQGTVLVLGDKNPYWGILHVIDIRRGKDHRIDISRFASGR